MIQWQYSKFCCTGTGGWLPHTKRHSTTEIQSYKNANWRELHLNGRFTQNFIANHFVKYRFKQQICSFFPINFLYKILLSNDRIIGLQCEEQSFLFNFAVHWPKERDMMKERALHWWCFTCYHWTNNVCWNTQLQSNMKTAGDYKWCSWKWICLMNKFAESSLSLHTSCV